MATPSRTPLWLSLFLILGLLGAFGIASLIFVPRFTRKVDELRNPQRVVSWKLNTLRLEDGRDVPVPDLSSLPAAAPPLLQAAFLGGVEIGPGGRLFVVLKIDHRKEWVGDQVARLDLSRLLIFNGIGTPAGLLPELSARRLLTRPRLTAQGWDRSDYLGFTAWCEILDQGVVPLFEKPR